MTHDHAMRSQNPRAVARRLDSDDVLFAVPDDRLAIVHLTYNKETKPDWPHFVFIDDWDDLAD